MSEKKESWLPQARELSDSSSALADLVKEDTQQSKSPQAKKIPEDQISPALSAFENRIAKERKVE